jgi:hypothetical protein
MIEQAGLKIEHRLREHVQLFGITIPITIGYMVIARKP